MKKLILLLLCAVSSFSLAATQASDGSNLRDSIFRIYRSMPADTARTQFLKDIFAVSYTHLTLPTTSRV